MNTIKRTAGILWMLLAPVLAGFLFWQAAEKINNATPALRSNLILQWAIILFIFIPVCTGLFIFGWYAIKGYYDQQPGSKDSGS